MLNRVILIGRLAQDPELKYTTQGTAVCNFTLAVGRKFNRDQTDFIDIVVWRGLAENCATYLGKGRLAAVEGRLQIRSYETQDGQKRRVTEVIADDVRFLDKAGAGPSGASGGQGTPHQDEWSDLGREVDGDNIDLINNQDEEDEIPF